MSTGLALAQADDVDCASGAGFCVVSSTGLPLRLLAKPQSNIYAEMDEGSEMVEANVPAFSVMIAFEMIDVNYDANNFATEGWFKVGPSPTETSGYMKASDVVEWKQALALAYTNPGAGSGRSPVLMFGTLDNLETTVKDIDAKTVDPVAMYQEIYDGNAPEGIISREQDAFVDINDTFYLLPILASEDMSAYRADGGDMRALQIAAVNKDAREAGVADACDLQSEGADECLEGLQGEGASELRLDVVFVIDMTSSMQPHIEAVTNAVREASQQLTKYLPDETRLKFGLVGYRDSIAVTPDLEFVSKNFTPELVSGSEFSNVVSGEGVHASATGSDDWAEEVYAGVLEGLNSNWSPDAARVIVLVGDASSHGLEHPSNTTQLTDIALRQMADENNVYLAAIYIGNAEGPDTALARPQFEALSMNGTDVPAFAIVTGGAAAEELEAELQHVTDGIIQTIGKGDINSINTGNLGGGGGAGAAVASAVRAAFVEYIGKDAQPPTNIVAWVSDQDLADTSTKSLEVKVVLRKSDLQELMLLLDSLMKAYRGGNQTTGGFFGGLQGGSTASSFDLGIAETEQFINTDIVPKWIKALPYKSEVLNLSLEAFRNFTPDDKTQFETRIEALINLYDDILNRQDAWVALNDKGSVDDEVNMLDLSNLP